MLQEWGLEEQLAHLILRDNVRNMKKDNIGVPGLGCVAHSLQTRQNLHCIYLAKGEVSNNFWMSVLTLRAQFYIIILYFIDMFDIVCLLYVLQFVK